MVVKEINRIDYWKKNKDYLDFEIVDLQLFFSTRPKKLLEKDHRLNFWVVIYVYEGHGRHFIDFEALDYQAGDILFIQKNQVHRLEVNSQAKGYVMHINEPFLIHLNQSRKNVFLEFMDQSFGSPVIAADTSIHSTNRKLLELLYTEYQRKIGREFEVFIRTLFESFILSLRQDYAVRAHIFKTREYQTFSEFRDLVESHYMTHLTLDGYASLMGVSKKTINQATRKIVGMSAKAFANHRLFLEIKRHLSQGDLLIYEIAELLGFDEPANMTKFFKKHAGVSPRQFRDGLHR
jgi:AraC-like DNA-binding protein